MNLDDWIDNFFFPLSWLNEAVVEEMLKLSYDLNDSSHIECRSAYMFP
jgi:hypothetical protein